jgi:hypothetical protein
MTNAIELRDALSFVAALINAGESAMDDGKIDLADLPLVVPLLPKLAAAMAGMSDIPKEFKNLSAEDKLQLSKWFGTELELDDDKLEAVIEKSLVAVLALSDVFMLLKK